MNPIFALNKTRTSTCSALDFALLDTLLPRPNINENRVATTEPSSMIAIQCHVPSYHRSMTDMFLRQLHHNDKKDQKVTPVVVVVQGSRSVSEDVHACLTDDSHDISTVPLLLSALCDIASLEQIPVASVVPLWCMLQDKALEPTTTTSHTKVPLSLHFQDEVVKLLLQNGKKCSEIKWKKIGEILTRYKLCLHYPLTFQQPPSPSSLGVPSAASGHTQRALIVRSISRNWLLALRDHPIWKRLTFALESVTVIGRALTAAERTALTGLMETLQEMHALLVVQGRHAHTAYYRSLIAVARDVDAAFAIARKNCATVAVKNTLGQRNVTPLLEEMLCGLQDSWRNEIVVEGCVAFSQQNTSVEGSAGTAISFRTGFYWSEDKTMVSRKRVREEAETSSASSVPADPRALLVLQDVAKLDKQGRFRYPSLHAKSLQAYVAFAKRLPTCTVVMEHQLRRFLSPAPPTGVSVAVAEDAAPLQQVPLLHSEKEIFQFLRVELDALVDEQLQLHGPDHADSKLALSMRQELVRAAQTHHMKML